MLDSMCYGYNHVQSLLSSPEVSTVTYFEYMDETLMDVVNSSHNEA